LRIQHNAGLREVRGFVRKLSQHAHRFAPSRVRVTSVMSCAPGTSAGAGPTGCVC